MKIAVVIASGIAMALAAQYASDNGFLVIAAAAIIASGWAIITDD